MWAAQTAIILIGGMICFLLITRYNKKKISISSLSEEAIQADSAAKN
jgi:hypothetical protein